MSDYLYLYVFVGVLIASMPVLDRRFVSRFDRMDILPFIIGLTIVCVAWPLVLYVALKGASNSINKGNSRE